MGVQPLSLDKGSQVRLFRGGHHSFSSKLALEPEVRIFDSIKPPEGGWKIFKEPREIKYFSDDRGTALIEFNEHHRDLSTSTKDENLAQFRKEVKAVLDSDEVQHLIISFDGCRSGEKLLTPGEVTLADGRQGYSPSRLSQLESFFMELEEGSFYTGKKLSLAHLEEAIYKETGLKGVPNLVHENVPDAVMNYRSQSKQVHAPTAKSAKLYQRPRLALEEDDLGSVH